MARWPGRQRGQESETTAVVGGSLVCISCAALYIDVGNPSLSSAARASEARVHRAHGIVPLGPGYMQYALSPTSLTSRGEEGATDRRTNYYARVLLANQFNSII